ncbi:MAG: hypothetical protein ACRDE5_05110, partial [Ginsengibacter sp.]
DNSSGQYISPLSADDWFAAKNIEKKVNVISKTNNTGAIFSNGWFYFQKENKFTLNDSSTFKRGNLFKEVLVEPDCIFYVGMLYKREIFDKVGKWDENLVIEDTDMYIRIGLSAAIDYINEPLVYYRRRSESASNNKQFMMNGFIQYYEKYKAEPWINMKEWLSERYRSFATDCIDKKKNKEASFFLMQALKINPLSLKHFSTLFYLIRQCI